MEKPDCKPRNILLSDRIEQSTVGAIIRDIFEINFDDDQKSEVYKDWKREPIKLFINSYGGSVYDGLALVDVISQSRTPIHTVCIGSCMSMGLWVWMSGSKRLIGENATLMFHDLATFCIGKTEIIKQELSEMHRLQKMLTDFITEHSKVKIEDLQDIISRKAEWYIPANEAISLKLADGYYK